MAKIYYDKDASAAALKGKKVAVVGYGIQGRGQALNLRDSGVKVIVAQRPGGPNYDLAKKDGFKPVSAAEAAKAGDVIILLAQDTLQAKIYKESIAPHLHKGKTLGFSHGFAILYGLIRAPKSVDVIMIAPKGPGSLVRSQYEEGRGVPALVAVHQDASGKAKATALAWARGIGATRAGVLETTFKEETETDHFGEQAVLCGGASALIKAGFETLVEAGYQPEVAYFECLHELKLITDMIWARGIQGMRMRVSDTAKYGDVTRGPRVVDAHVKDSMRKILAEIQAGEFAEEWVSEDEAGRPRFKELMNQDSAHPIEEVGARLRKMMSWIDEGQGAGLPRRSQATGRGGKGRGNRKTVAKLKAKRKVQASR